MQFDYNKALDTLKNDPVALRFIQDNKAAFVGMTEDAIFSTISSWVRADDKGVVSFLTLDEQSAAMVSGSADVATRRADFKRRVEMVASVLAPLVIKALLAGVVL